MEIYNPIPMNIFVGIVCGYIWECKKVIHINKRIYFESIVGNQSGANINRSYASSILLTIYVGVPIIFLVYLFLRMNPKLFWSGSSIGKHKYYIYTTWLILEMTHFW